MIGIKAIMIGVGAAIAFAHLALSVVTVWGFRRVALRTEVLERSVADTKKALIEIIRRAGTRRTIRGLIPPLRPDPRSGDEEPSSQRVTRARRHRR